MRKIKNKKDSKLKIVKAGDLKEGMYVMTKDGPVKALKIEKKVLEEPVNVYNIEVADNHNYFVGESKVLVHNKNGTKKIPQGFSEEEFDKFSNAINELIEKQKLPNGETYVQGSRANGTARFDSDIDIMHRVNEEAFDKIVQGRLTPEYPDSRIYKTITKAAKKGKLDRFSISKTFNRDFYDILDPVSPYEVDFSIIKKGSPFDQEPFIEIK